MASTVKFHLIDAAAKRNYAEELIRKQEAVLSENIADRSPEEIQQLFHELRVHQIELEMQNEELRMTQAELEASRVRLADLYDYAPVGYVTESETGMIIEANATVAAVLGVDKSSLFRLPISRFILPEKTRISTTSTANSSLRPMRHR